ncbi:399_t:CDS:2 [Rhizophagus irregularis]|nr:399_t:CDS:2 [Rhizophagus irregularis]
MFHRERVESEYEYLFNEFKMGAATWSPLASGVLTGKHNERIAEDSRMALTDNAVMRRLREGATPAQLALAWCMKHPKVNTVITGASKPEQMEENLRAVALLPKLTPEFMVEIDKILDNLPPPQFNFRDS